MQYIVQMSASAILSLYLSSWNVNLLPRRIPNLGGMTTASFLAVNIWYRKFGRNVNHTDGNGNGNGKKYCLMQNHLSKITLAGMPKHIYLFQLLRGQFLKTRIPSNVVSNEQILFYLWSATFLTCACVNYLCMPSKSQSEYDSSKHGSLPAALSTICHILDLCLRDFY